MQTLLSSENGSWVLIGAGAPTFALHQRVGAPTVNELQLAYLALGREVPANAWAIRVIATEEGVLQLLEAEPSLLACMRLA